MNDLKFAKTLKYLRNHIQYNGNHKLTLRAITDLTTTESEKGISRTYLSQLETQNIIPSPNVIYKLSSGLAKATNVPTEMLYKFLFNLAGYDGQVNTELVVPLFEQLPNADFMDYVQNILCVQYTNDKDSNMNDFILEWANSHDLLHAENAKTQFIKLTEEVGELGQGILKDKPEQIYDTLGDIQVVLIILAEQLGYDYNEALAYAYEEIKERKGKTEHGTFIKEADL